MSMPAFAWPEGRRVAVIVSVLLETWSEGKAPSYFPRTTPNKPGFRISPASTGRPMAARKACGGSRAFSTRSVSRRRCSATGARPSSIRTRSRNMCAPGTTSPVTATCRTRCSRRLTPEEERGRIRQTLDAIEKAGGKRPTGWITPIYGWSEHTIDIVVQEKLVWCSDALDLNLPYRQKTKSGSVVVIPWSDFVDNRALRASPQIYFDVYKETFDYLHACEPGSLHQRRRAQPFRRPPADVGDVPEGPAISVELPGRLVPAARRGGAVDARQQDRESDLRQPVLQPAVIASER